MMKNEELQGWIEETAREEDIPLQKGVYLQTTGPNFESPAEIRMYGLLGADAVGMSTACEAIAARHAGVRVCGISCISNMASGISEEELSHLDVQAIADQRSGEFERIVTKSIEKIGAHIGTGRSLRARSTLRTAGSSASANTTEKKPRKAPRRTGMRRSTPEAI